MTSVTTCPRCGAAVPPGASLCPSCAGPLGAAAGIGVPSGHTTEPVLLPGTVPAPGHPMPASRMPQAAGFAAQTLPGFPAPAPVPAGPTGAPLGRRVLAWLIDAIVIGIPAGVVTAIMVPGLMDKGVPNGDGTSTVPIGDVLPVLGLAWGLTLVAGLVLVAVEGTTGRTVGKLALGLRTQDVATGRPLGVGRGLLRGLVFGVFVLVCWVGELLVLLSPAFDKSPLRQGWQDKAVRAVVVRVESAGPYVAPGSFATGAGAWSGPAAAAGPVATAPAVSAGPSAAYPGMPFPPAPVAQAAPPAVSAPAASAPAGWAPQAAPSPAAPAPAGPAAPTPSSTGGLITGVPGAPAPAAPSAPTTAWAGGQLQAPAAPAAPAPAAPAATAPAAPAPGAGGGFELGLPDGSTVVVTGPTLLGRDPAVPPNATGPAPLLVAVPDSARSVSKTHAELVVDAAGLWLVDRGSTNGSAVEVPGVPPVKAAPGQRVHVPVGATVRLGDAALLVRGEGPDGPDETTVMSLRRPPSGGGSW